MATHVIFSLRAPDRNGTWNQDCWCNGLSTATIKHSSLFFGPLWTTEVSERPVPYALRSGRIRRRQSAVEMWLGAGLACDQFALLPRSSITSRTADSECLHSAEVFFHGGDNTSTRAEEWSILTNHTCPASSLLICLLRERIISCTVLRWTECDFSKRAAIFSSLSSSFLRPVVSGLRSYSINAKHRNSWNSH
jgi:hypothetical protein